MNERRRNTTFWRKSLVKRECSPGEREQRMVDEDERRGGSIEERIEERIEECIEERWMKDGMCEAMSDM